LRVRNRFGLAPGYGAKLLFVWAALTASIWLLALFCVGRAPSEVRREARIANSPAEALSTWDGSRYADIARNGYSTTPRRDRLFAFAPLFPNIARFLGGPSHAVVAGIFFAQLCLLAALFVLARLGSSGDNPASLFQQPALWLLVSPVGFFFYMFYPESLFLLLTLAMTWAYRSDRFALAGVLGLFVGVTRPTAVTVPALFVWDVVARWRRGQPWFGRGFCAMTPLIGFLSYVAIVGYVLNDPLGYVHVQNKYWNLQWTVPLLPLLKGTAGLLYDLVQGNLRPVDQFVRLLSSWSILALIVWGWRRCDPGYRLYLVASMLFLHSQVPPRSTLRHELVLFPAYILLSQTRLARGRLAPLLAILLLLIQFAMFIRAATWGWVA